MLQSDEVHVVSVSSGLGSAYLWSVVLDRHPGAVGVFADVNGEDDDNYRFLWEVHATLGRPELAYLNDGRTIWDVFRKERYLGNTMVDSCSRELKRIPIRRYLEANFSPANTVLHIAIDWTEEHRIPATRDGWADLGWTTRFIMAEENLDKNHALKWCAEVGIEPPLLTRMGWPHANCGGGCVRAGLGQWAALLVERPEWFARWEAEETAFREWIGKDVAICRDRRKDNGRGGKAIPLPLPELRRRVDAGEVKPMRTDGACNCMSPTPEVPK